VISFFRRALGLRKPVLQGPTLTEALAARNAARDAQLRDGPPLFADSYFAETCGDCGVVFDAEVEGQAPWNPERRGLPRCGFCLLIASKRQPSTESKP